MLWKPAILMIPVVLDLIVVYPETYPDVIPELSFETTDDENGELTEAENAHVLGQLGDVVCLSRSITSPSLLIRETAIVALY
jgi:hypothetical protein